MECLPIIEQVPSCTDWGRTWLHMSRLWLTRWPCCHSLIICKVALSKISVILGLQTMGQVVGFWLLASPFFFTDWEKTWLPQNSRVHSDLHWLLWSMLRLKKNFQTWGRMKGDGLMGLFFAFFNSVHQIIYFCPRFNQWEPHHTDFCVFLHFLEHLLALGAARCFRLNLYFL